MTGRSIIRMKDYPGQDKLIPRPELLVQVCAESRDRISSQTLITEPFFLHFPVSYLLTQYEI